MAKLFMEHRGTRYEKRYNGKSAYWVGPDGKVIKGSVAHELEESQRRAVIRAHPEGRERMELTESSRRIIEEAGERRREARQRKLNSAAIAEAERTARRVQLLKGAGMNEKEAGIAARGRGGFLNPLCE